MGNQVAAQMSELAMNAMAIAFRQGQSVMEYAARFVVSGWIDAGLYVQQARDIVHVELANLRRRT